MGLTVLVWYVHTRIAMPRQEYRTSSIKSMKIRLSASVILATIVSAASLRAEASKIPPTPPDSAAAGADYHIGAGDTLEVSVWKEPDASVPNVVVLPDGKIGLPLLKELNVAGLTPRQVEQAITERLSAIINTPDVTVVVTKVNSKKIYVVGAANKEGPLAYTYRMTVMQAISEAGGLTEYAKRKKIYVLRAEGGKEVRMPFNYDQVVKGEKMEQNIEVLPGDVLVVPQ
jgi:polysaccharide export outer membrane protein